MVGGEDGGASPVRVRVQQSAGIGASEREDRLVGVAGQHELPRAVTHLPDEAVLERVQVLGVIDEQVVNPGPFGREEFLVRPQRAQGAGDEFRRVHRRCRLRRRAPRRGAQQVHLFVLLPEPPGRDPLPNAVPFPQLGQVLGAEAAFGGAQQQVAEFGREAGEQQRRPEVRRPVRRSGAHIAGEQVTDHRVLVGARQQPRRWGTDEERLTTQDAEGVGVDGAHHRLPHRHRRTRLPGPGRDQAGDPGPQLRGGPPPRGQHQHAFRIAPGQDPVGGGLGEQGGLPGARSAQHAEQAGSVVEDPQRRLVPPVRRAVVPAGTDQGGCWRAHTPMQPRHPDAGDTRVGVSGA